jgi:hypothetical protein
MLLFSQDLGTSHFKVVHVLVWANRRTLTNSCISDWSLHQTLVLCPTCVPEKVDVKQRGANKNISVINNGVVRG